MDLREIYIISRYNINWFVSMTKKNYVYCAVRTEYLILIYFNGSI